MSVLIGGSGSTGSSLLRQILNRHPDLFCGPETSLFCKDELFKNWKKNKNHILSKGRNGLRSKGWHIYRGVDLLKEELNNTREQLQLLIQQSTSLSSFSKQLFAHNLRQTGSKIWMEKTPSNAYNFAVFLDQFEQSKVIHIYRNPYDAITSLLKRGFSHYYAVSLYLLNTSFGLSQSKSERYHQLSYENLVQDSKYCMQNLCEFLDITYSDNMLEVSDNQFSDDPNQIGKWNYNEQSSIGADSIGTFASLPINDQRLLISAVKSISVKDDLMKKHNLNQRNIEDICRALDYKFVDDTSDERHFKSLKKQKQADLRLRARKLAYFNPLNYPIELNEKYA